MLMTSVCVSFAIRTGVVVPTLRRAIGSSFHFPKAGLTSTSPSRSYYLSFWVWQCGVSCGRVRVSLVDATMPQWWQ